MLITTWSGITVNSDFVRYVALKRQESSELASEVSGLPNEADADGFKVLLCLEGEERVVLAAKLSRGAAEFLRKDLTHAWSEGHRTYAVEHALERHANGAYYASEAVAVSPAREEGED